MHIQEIDYHSSAYQEMLELRDTVLRKPLGLKLDLSKLGNDKTDFLIACYEDKQMIGCVILSPLQDDAIKLRQMAVLDAFQGLGIGAEIVAWAEAFAKHKGFKIMEMHARKYALPFYEKQGYHSFGDEFVEVGIPHFKMKKQL